MGISESSAKNFKKIILAITSGIAKGLLNEGLKKIGAGEVVSEVYGNVIDAVSDSADNKLSGWLEKLYEDKKLSSKIKQIYKSEIDALVMANEAYLEMPLLMEFASSKSDTAIFKSDIINSIDEWRKTRTQETKISPSISNAEIEAFLDRLYHNIEIKMALDSDLQIFWNVLRNTRKSEEIQNTLDELIEQGKSRQDMLNALYRKQEFIEDDTEIYFKNYSTPLCIHRGEVENQVTLKDVFVMPDVEIDGHTQSLDTAVRDFIKRNAHEAMILLAHGGFGKTSFVSYMAAYKPYFCGNRPIHIIRLREYSKSSIDTLCDDIADSNKRYRIAKDAVIVFDGLDELCMIKGGNDDDKAAKIIDQLVKRFYDYSGDDKRKIIITSRPGFVNQRIIREIERGFESVKLVQSSYMHFNKSKCKEFVEKIEKADIRLTEQDKKAGCDFIRSIDGSNRISDIYSAPFILYLICCVQIKDIKIEPEMLGNSWYLFRKIFHDLYMKSQYKDRNYATEIEDNFQYNKEIIYEKTCEFAFEMYKSGLGKDDVIHLDDIAEKIDGFKECYALSCYFNKKNDNAIEFSHNYIRDFFICECILKELNKSIGEGDFTEEKGEKVADWCCENLLHDSLRKRYDDNRMILDFVDAYFKSNDNIYRNFNIINNNNISFIFNAFYISDKYKNMIWKIKEFDDIIYYAPIDVFFAYSVMNIQEIFYRYFRNKLSDISIKWLTRYQLEYYLNILKLYGADMTSINLKYIDTRNIEYDSKTLFKNNFDPQVHGMIYVIRENEIKENLDNIPILIRRQMKIRISNYIDEFLAIRTENEIYKIESNKYDPVKNEKIDIRSVCMTPDDKDSVININTVCAGETIRFGNYEWLIIKTDIEARKILVISKAAISYLPFNDKDEAVTWENCSLRKWLNNEFIKEFSNFEREQICETRVENSTDRIFILSQDEIGEYNYRFDLDNYYMIDRLTRTVDSNDDKRVILFNQYTGSGDENNLKIDESCAINPALWLKFESIPYFV